MTRSFRPTADGHVLVHDEETGRAWRVDSDAAAVLEALEGGWRPGRDGPPGLDGRGTREELAEVVARLERAGLVGDGPPGAGTRRGLVLGRVRSPAWARRAILRAAHAAPLVAAAFLVVTLGTLWWWGHLAGWTEVARDAGLTTWLGMILLIVALQLALVLPHELGHALPLAAATGRPVAVGIRVVGGVPRAFSAVHEVLTLERRRDRLAVLAGGVSVELAGWALVALLLAWLGPGPPGIVAPVVVGAGLASAALNLLPFRGTDGYWLLSEATDRRRLGRQARAAAFGRYFRRPAEGAQPRWLAWYGLVDLGLVPLAILLVGLVASAATGWWLVIVVTAVLAAVTARGAAGRAREAHAAEERLTSAAPLP